MRGAQPQRLRLEQGRRLRPLEALAAMLHQGGRLEVVREPQVQAGSQPRVRPPRQQQQGVHPRRRRPTKLEPLPLPRHPKPHAGTVRPSGKTNQGWMPQNRTAETAHAHAPCRRNRREGRLLASLQRQVVPRGAGRFHARPWPLRRGQALRQSPPTTCCPPLPNRGNSSRRILDTTCLGR